MTAASSSPREHPASWYVAHCLLLLNVLLLVVAGLPIEIAARVGFADESFGLRLVEVVALPASVILWLWMLSFHFQVRPNGRFGWWGWALVFAMVVVTPFYFFAVWRPQALQKVA